MGKPRTRDHRGALEQMVRRAIPSLKAGTVVFEDLVSKVPAPSRKKSGLALASTGELRADLKKDKDLGVVLQRAKPLKEKPSPLTKVMRYADQSAPEDVVAINTEIEKLEKRRGVIYALLQVDTPEAKLTGATRKSAIKEWRQAKSTISALRAKLPKNMLQLSDPERYEVGDYERLAANELRRLQVGQQRFMLSPSEKLPRYLEPHRIIDNFIALLVHRRGAYVGTIPQKYIPQFIQSIHSPVLFTMVGVSFAKFARSEDVYYLLQQFAAHLPVKLLADPKLLKDWRMEVATALLTETKAGRQHRDRLTIKALEKHWPKFMQAVAARLQLEPANDNPDSESEASVPALKKAQRRFGRPSKATRQILAGSAYQPKPPQTPDREVTGTKRVRSLIKRHAVQQPKATAALATVTGAEALAEVKAKIAAREAQFLQELLAGEDRAPTDFEKELALDVACRPTAVDKKPKFQRPHPRRPRLTPRERRLKKRGLLPKIVPDPPAG